MLNKVREWLQARELSYEDTEPNVIATAFSTQLENGDEHGFSMFILSIEDGYGDSYVRFAIVPFIEQSYEGYPASLSLLIGQINHDMPQLKFAFDGDGDLELLCDILFERVDAQRLDNILQLMVNYAGLHYAELSL